MSKRRATKIGSDYINKSKFFLLPMLDTSIYHICDKVNYLIDVNFLQIGFPQIVLIFDNIDYEPLKEDVHRLSMLPEYLDSEYGDDEKEVAMFFDIPLKYRKDFEKFTTGSYSEFSKEYKEILVKRYGEQRGVGVTKDGLPIVNVYDAISPLDSTKIAIAKRVGVKASEIKEVFSPPDLNKEEYKIVEEL